MWLCLISGLQKLFHTKKFENWEKNQPGTHIEGYGGFVLV